MKKKSYIRPCISVGQMDITELICVSQGITSDVGIGYGGVDEEGAKHVDSRRDRTVWEDDL